MLVHQVAVLVLDGAVPMDVAIPAQVFRPRPGLSYKLVMCGLIPGTVASSSGFGFAVPSGLEALDTADTVIVPGFEDPVRTMPLPVIEALQRAAMRGARMVSICTGAFALAAAGLLDGRRATTHWQEAGDLARLYPLVTVDPDVLFVDDGSILTSAGVAAGIDLCLHLVRRDHGVHASNAVARAIVAAPYRSGGQAQYVPRTLPADEGEYFSATRAWVLARLGEPIMVSDLARHAMVSPRTFTRRFRQDTGYTPLQWLLRARIDHARDLLEATDKGIDQIASQVGLGTGTNLRAHFQRILGTTPTAYRQAFAA